MKIIIGMALFMAWFVGGVVGFIAGDATGYIRGTQKTFQEAVDNGVAQYQVDANGAVNKIWVKIPANKETKDIPQGKF
jgi:uncharacterized membrane protein (UPF0182 family)